MSFLTPLLSRWGLSPVGIPDGNMGEAGFFAQYADAAKESGDVANQLIEALKDNRIDRAEALRFEVEVFEAVRSFLCLNHLVQKAAR